MPTTFLLATKLYPCVWVWFRETNPRVRVNVLVQSNLYYPNFGAKQNLGHDINMRMRSAAVIRSVRANDS